jgi:mRNA interferase MazF
VLSRDATIPRRRRAIVAPCTTNVRGRATEVALDPEHDPVPIGCVVNLDSLDAVSVGLLVERAGRLSSDRMHEICGRCPRRGRRLLTSEANTVATRSGGRAAAS